MARRLFFELAYLVGVKPWDSGVPPPELVELIEGPHVLKPGSAIDLGNPSARRLWSQLSDHEPDNLAVWVALMDAALDAKDGNEARRILKQMRRLEGGEGAQTACGEAALAR